MTTTVIMIRVMTIHETRMKTNTDIGRACGITMLTTTDIENAECDIGAGNRSGNEPGVGAVAL